MYLCFFHLILHRTRMAEMSFVMKAISTLLSSLKRAVKENPTVGKCPHHCSLLLSALPSPLFTSLRRRTTTNLAAIIAIFLLCCNRFIITLTCFFSLLQWTVGSGNKSLSCTLVLWNVLFVTPPLSDEPCGRHYKNTLT